MHLIEKAARRLEQLLYAFAGVCLLLLVSHPDPDFSRPKRLMLLKYEEPKYSKDYKKGQCGDIHVH